MMLRKSPPAPERYQPHTRLGSAARTRAARSTPGDFTARCHTIAFATQTGLPLCIGGTTTTEAGPRAYQIGLDITANLQAEDVGQPFWISGVETGDDVFDDPWLAIDLGRRTGPIKR